MAISINRYVDITSGVGGTGGVRTRELVGRIFSTNQLIPTQSFIEFTSADEVATYFGSTSEEYKRAVFYFGWISPNITKATKISFARWASADTAPQCFGKVANYALATFTAITSGTLTITLGADTNTINAIDLSAAVSLSGVASLIQTAIRTQTGSMWTSAVVTYDAVRKSFNLTGGSTGAAVISIGSTTLSTALGWTTGAILSDGVVAESVTDTLAASDQASTNFGSFLFMPSLTDDQIEEAALWNDAKNVKYQYCLPATEAKAADYYALIGTVSGVAQTEVYSGEYAEMIPMIVMAATNYALRNSVMNYMYRQFSVTPTVTTDAKATSLDAVRCNYYGQTQTAGQNISFYQRGVMFGGVNDPVDQNVYANEVWLKDACQANVLSLQLALPKISANNNGRAQLRASLQSVVDQALFNGVISSGKVLSTEQKLYIASITGDQNAWHEVYTKGYWLDIVIQTTVTVSGTTEYKAVYTLVYSKDDVIRKVEGRHVLI